MSFSVKIDTAGVSVEPGNSIPVVFEVTNTSTEADNYELTIDGIDPEWVAIPAPSFVIEPNAGQSHRFFLRPPRQSNSVAGSYPFVVRIRSLESGLTKEAQGMLEVKAYNHLSVDAQPRKVSVSPYKRSAQLTVNVANLGNVDQVLQLFATDTDDIIAFEFEKDQIRVSPGQQESVSLTASASSSPFLANPRLQPVTISARNVSNPSLAASTGLQVEQRGMLSIANALAVFVVALIFGVWYATRPKAPIIDSLTAIPMNPIAGDTVQVKWSSSNSTSVELNVAGTIHDKQQPAGEFSYVADKAGKVTIYAIPFAENRRGEQAVQVVDVRPKVVAPDAGIIAFSVKPTTAKLGESVTVSFQVNEAVTSLYLSPIGALDPKATGCTIHPDAPGDMNLKLTARNADGKVTEQSLVLHVIQVSEAIISSFTTNSSEINGASGLVNLSWSIDKFKDAKITYDDKSVPVTSASGSVSVEINESTTFLLTATDSKGVVAAKKVKVTVNHPAEPIDGAPGAADGTDKPKSDPPPKDAAGTANAPGHPGKMAPGIH